MIETSKDYKAGYAQGHRAGTIKALNKVLEAYYEKKVTRVFLTNEIERITGK